MLRFKNRVAIVTGAARGMGRACSIAFAKEGAAVALVDVQKDIVEKVGDEIKNEGGQALCVLCNVSNSEEVKRAVDRVITEFGYSLSSVGMVKPTYKAFYNNFLFAKEGIRQLSGIN